VVPFRSTTSPEIDYSVSVALPDGVRLFLVFIPHKNESFTRSIAGCLRFFTLIQSLERPPAIGPVASLGDQTF
jgi:hypothetical protein